MDSDWEKVAEVQDCVVYEPTLARVEGILGIAEAVLTTVFFVLNDGGEGAVE